MFSIYLKFWSSTKYMNRKCPTGAIKPFSTPALMKSIDLKLTLQAREKNHTGPTK